MVRSAGLTFAFLAGLTCGVLTGGVASATMACDSAQDATSPAASADCAPVASLGGSIVARVQLAGLPGVIPARGPSTPAPQVLGPGAAVTVQLIDPQAPDAPVSEQMSDTLGEVRFDVTAGTYWVVVPWNDHIVGLPGAPPVPAYLPNGQAALAWEEVSILSGSADVLLTVVGALP